MTSVASPLHSSPESKNIHLITSLLNDLDIYLVYLFPELLRFLKCPEWAYQICALIITSKQRVNI